MYTNQTGWFPIMSHQGNKYLMVQYNYDSAILTEPLKNCTGPEMIQAHK
jgi:hypothetical protein